MASRHAPATRRIAMKAIPGIAVVSLLSVGLLGCTSAGTRSAYVAPAAVDSGAVTETRTVTKARYIEEVEKLARLQGVRVYWVIPPTKRVSVVHRGGNRPSGARPRASTAAPARRARRPARPARPGPHPHL